MVVGTNASVVKCLSHLYSMLGMSRNVHLSNLFAFDNYLTARHELVIC